MRIYVGLLLACLVFQAAGCPRAYSQTADANSGSAFEYPLWQNSRQADTKTPGTGQMFIRMIFGTIIVAAMAVAAAYLSRKTMPGLLAAKGKHIKVLETISLGKGRALYFVEVQDKKFLLGGTYEQIARLYDFDGNN